MAKGLGKWYVEIEKQGFWRGKVHTWVNRYIMTGPDPTTTDAQSVITGLKNIEDAIHPLASMHAGVGFVQGRAYGAAGGSPLTTVDYNVGLAPGTATGFAGSCGFSPASTLAVCCAVTSRSSVLSATGKPVFLKKYFRGCGGSEEVEAGSPISGTILAAVNAAAAPWATGVGGTFYTVTGLVNPGPWASPQAQSYYEERQVPKGKKRKKTTLTQKQSSNLLESLIEGTLSTGAQLAAGAAL